MIKSIMVSKIKTYVISDAMEHILEDIGKYVRKNHYTEVSVW